MNLNKEEIKNVAVVHVMNFMALRMMTTAFALAFEKGLSDLKGYMSPCDLCDIYEGHHLGSLDIEIELLNTVEDQGVKTVVASMLQIFSFLDIYLMINNLDIMEIAEDSASMDLAINIYIDMPVDVSLNYEQQRRDERNNYYWYNLVLWRSIQMILNDRINFDDDDEEFNDQYHEFVYEELSSDNKNADLIYGLTRSLELGMIGREG